MAFGRNIFLMGLCCYAQIALAAGEDVSDAIFDKSKHDLKPIYRKCSENEDCTYVADVCDGYFAVNTALQDTVDSDIQEIADRTDCSVQRGSGPAPKVRCVEGLCKIIASHIH